MRFATWTKRYSLSHPRRGTLQEREAALCRPLLDSAVALWWPPIDFVLLFSFLNSAAASKINPAPLGVREPEQRCHKCRWHTFALMWNWSFYSKLSICHQHVENVSLLSRLFTDSCNRITNAPRETLLEINKTYIKKCEGAITICMSISRYDIHK